MEKSIKADLASLSTFVVLDCITPDSAIGSARNGEVDGVQNKDSGVRNGINGVQNEDSGVRNGINGVRNWDSGVRNGINGVLNEGSGVRNSINGVYRYILSVFSVFPWLI